MSINYDVELKYTDFNEEEQDVVFKAIGDAAKRKLNLERATLSIDLSIGIHVINSILNIDEETGALEFEEMTIVEIDVPQELIKVDPNKLN